MNAVDKLLVLRDGTIEAFGTQAEVLGRRKQAAAGAAPAQPQLRRI
jgi:ABC-type protease/lipase transport system fused ATPase/permease subunit